MKKEKYYQIDCFWWHLHDFDDGTSSGGIKICHSQMWMVGVSSKDGFLTSTWEYGILRLQKNWSHADDSWIPSSKEKTWTNSWPNSNWIDNYLQQKPHKIAVWQFDIYFLSLGKSSIGSTVVSMVETYQESPRGLYHGPGGKKNLVPAHNFQKTMRIQGSSISWTAIKRPLTSHDTPTLRTRHVCDTCTQGICVHPKPFMEKISYQTAQQPLFKMEQCQRKYWLVDL